MDRGEVDHALASGTKRLDAFYSYHFASHAQLEPAVCNAIHAASGHRIRTMPISAEEFSVRLQDGLQVARTRLVTPANPVSDP